MELTHINVSQLAKACVDEIYQAELIQNPKAPLPNPWSGSPVKVQGGGNLHGAKFHQLASEWMRYLRQLNGEESNSLTSAEALWHTLYDRFAKEKLLPLAQKDPQGSINLSEALRAFCGRLSDYHRPGSRWRAVLLADEYTIDSVILEEGGNQRIVISGIIDGLRLTPDNKLLLVDYKLTHGAHLPKDLVQLAIYARCLAKSKHGVQVDGLLEYYEPALHEAPVSLVEMAQIYETVVQPVVASLLPPEQQMNHPDPAPSASKPDIATVGAQSHLALGNRLVEAFAQFNLGVEIKDVVEGPQLYRYRIQPNPGVKIVSLANRAEDIQIALTLSQPPKIAAGAGFVSIDVPKEAPAVLDWDNVMQQVAPEAWPSRVSFPIGVGVGGDLIIGDLTNSNMAHMLVGGASGSGKSEFLKAVVASLMARNTPESLHLTLVDPKILTFGGVKDSPFLTAPVLTGSEDAMQALEEAATQMDQRYQRLADEGYENLSQRFDQGVTDLPFRVVIIDEYGDLILGEASVRKQFENLVVRLAQKGRAAGIHLVLATQRPDAKVVSPLVKANLPLKVCLRVTSHTNSRIILGETGGEVLLGKGDLLCDQGTGLVRAQAPYLSQECLSAIATNIHRASTQMVPTVR